MNRTDRLLAIVLELQANGRRRAEDLAALFEVGKRTIYRDIQALCEAGVPIVALPGQGYLLEEGYFLPPLRFTPDEALLLLLGSDLMARSFDAEYSSIAQSAGRKIAGALPESLREEVRSLQQSIRFVGSGVESSEYDGYLRMLRRAIVGRHTVRFEYRARHGSSEERISREVDPYALVHVSSAWYLVGHCHLRKDTRLFRVTRMSRPHILARSFTRPPGFTPERRPNERAEQRALTVRALFEAHVADWVREAQSFYMVGEEMRADGLLVTLRVRQEDEIVQWLLGWGRHVRVLEPDSLRRRLADEAEQLLKNHR